MWFGVMPDLGREGVRWVICKKVRGNTHYFVCVNPVDGKLMWSEAPEKAQTFVTRAGAEFSATSNGMKDTFLASRTTV